MFVFTPKRIVKQWPATINVATDGGKIDEVSIRFDLCLLPVDDYMAKLRDGNTALFDAIMVGFDGIAAPDGQILEDTPEHRAALYQHVPFTDALLNAYRAANTGEGARKN